MRGKWFHAGGPLLIVLGLWLIAAPWIIGGYARHAHAVEDTILGVLVAGAGMTSMWFGLATPAPLWTAVALGIVTWAMPMLFGEAGPSFSADNDLITGPLIALVAAAALVSRARLKLSATPDDPHAAAGQTSLS
jgi:hypothetical protein